MAWSLLVVSLVMQVAGMLLPEGLLLAAGLVMAGTVTRLFVTPHGHRPGRLWPRLPLRPEGDDGRR
ncbi:hypothetical protein [Streptomyces sp. NPDC019937]|uniref:hypothetical protein n=1 Tax=Streptomyces sp. NPDC019937 TaxID=3154787 RepID=UPI0033FC93F3